MEEEAGEAVELIGWNVTGVQSDSANLGDLDRLFDGQGILTSTDALLLASDDSSFVNGVESDGPLAVAVDTS